MNREYRFFEYYNSDDGNTYIVNIEDIRYLRSNGGNSTRIYFSDGDTTTAPFAIEKIKKIIKDNTGYIAKIS